MNISHNQSKYAARDTRHTNALNSGGARPKGKGNQGFGYLLQHSAGTHSSSLAMGSASNKDTIALASTTTSQNTSHRHMPHPDRLENGHSGGHKQHDHHDARERSDNPIHLERIQGLKEALRGEKNRVVALTGSNYRLQDEVTELQKTCAMLQRDLAACKRDLFSLQPCNQISNAKIADKVEHLSQQISSWTDEIFKDIDAIQQGLVGDLLYDHENFPIATSLDARTIGMLKRIPSTAEFFIHHVIFQRLQQTIFNEGVYLFGLHQEIGTFLQTIENSMGLLVPNRGTELQQSFI